MASLSGLALKVVSLCLLLMEFWGAVLVSAGPVSVVPKNCANIGAVTLELNDVKEYVCNTATLYREAAVEAYGTIWGPFPGPNTVPCEGYGPQNSNKTYDPWKWTLAYQGAVLDVLVTNNYLSEMVRIENRQISKDNFLQRSRLALVRNKTSAILPTLQTTLVILGQMPNITLSTTTWSTACSQEFVEANTEPGVWPPALPQNQTKDNVVMVKMYIYGTLNAACMTLKALETSMMDTFQTICPPNQPQ